MRTKLGIHSGYSEPKGLLGSCGVQIPSRLPY